MKILKLLTITSLLFCIGVFYHNTIHSSLQSNLLLNNIEALATDELDSEEYYCDKNGSVECKNGRFTKIMSFSLRNKQLY